MQRRGGARVAAIRASVVASGGVDPRERSEAHWLDGRIATPMSVYPGYETTASFGLDTYATFVVEVEATTGEIGIGLSHGGAPACWIVEQHLARFVTGRDPDDVAVITDQLWRATLHYGRKGLVVNAISAIDLALWDLRGKLAGEPVHALLGGAVRDELSFYATGPRPDATRQLGFIGAKLPLAYGPADGDDGLRRNLEQAASAREAVGDDALLAFDCWMALDLDYALRLADGVAALGFTWLEECLPPDDYAGMAELRRRAPRGLRLTTGEHEAGFDGFRLLVDMSCCDAVQPDLRWCGGLTEALRIAAYADDHAVQVLPHVSSVYAYHLVFTRPATPYAEFLMSSPDGTTVQPYFGALLVDEPVPVGGRMRLSALDRPGFGIELAPGTRLERPFDP